MFKLDIPLSEKNIPFSTIKYGDFIFSVIDSSNDCRFDVTGKCSERIQAFDFAYG